MATRNYTLPLAGQWNAASLTGRPDAPIHAVGFESYAASRLAADPTDDFRHASRLVTLDEVAGTAVMEITAPAAELDAFEVWTGTLTPDGILQKATEGRVSARTRLLASDPRVRGR